MENKKKKIDVINVAANPERKRKTQQEKQVLDTITKEMYKREKIEEEIKRRKTNQIKRNKKKKRIRIGMLGITSAVALLMAGCYKITKPKENRENNVTNEQEEIKITTKKEKLEIEKQNLLAFLKNLYIEQLEEISGKVLLTTAEITLNSASYEDYAFVNTRNRRNYYTWR